MDYIECPDGFERVLQLRQLEGTHCCRQLGHRVQHALRAFTPDDEKRLENAGPMNVIVGPMNVSATP